MNPLPDSLTGAYVHFRDALAERHGLTVRPLRYLRLCLDAADLPGQPANGGRFIVELLISGRRVRCLFDPQGTALITVFRPPVVLPGYVRQRTDHRLQNGKRRKFRRRRGRPYKRPAPGEESR